MKYISFQDRTKLFISHLMSLDRNYCTVQDTAKVGGNPKLYLNYGYCTKPVVLTLRTPHSQHEVPTKDNDTKLSIVQLSSTTPWTLSIPMSLTCKRIFISRLNDPFFPPRKKEPFSRLKTPNWKISLSSLFSVLPPFPCFNRLFLLAT